MPTYWNSSRIALAIKPSLIKNEIQLKRCDQFPRKSTTIQQQFSNQFSTLKLAEPVCLQPSAKTIPSLPSSLSSSSSLSLLLLESTHRLTPPGIFLNIPQKEFSPEIRQTRHSNQQNETKSAKIREARQKPSYYYRDAKSCSRNVYKKLSLGSTSVLTSPSMLLHPLNVSSVLLHQFHSSVNSLAEQKNQHQHKHTNKDENKPEDEHEHEHKHGVNSKNDSGSSAEHDHQHEHNHSMFGHTHTHAAADNIFVQEHGGLKNPAIRITWIGLLSNVGMAIGKGIGGVMFHSQALLADAIHSLSDLISDFLTLATISVAARPPTADFPHGYGKIETLGSLGVSVLLLLAGVSVGWSGLVSIIQQLFGDNHTLDVLTQFFGHGHSHSQIGTAAAEVTDAAATTVSTHSHGAVEAVANATNAATQQVDLNAMWLALGSIGIKEWLFHATMKIAKTTNSSVLVANAWHHRVDSLTSLVAVATIGGSYLFGLSWLDSLGGLLVSILIIQAGYKNGYTAALELADSCKTVPLDVVNSNTEAVQTALTRAIAQKTIRLGDFDINDVIIMSSGPNYTSSVLLKTRPLMDVKTATTISRFIEKELLAHDPRLKQITVKCVDSDTLEQDQELLKQRNNQKNTNNTNNKSHL